MLQTFLAAGLTLTLAAPALAQTPLAAGSLQVTTKRLGEVDTGKLKGDPSRLAWSPDGATLYLQTVERDRFGNAKEYHYTMAAAGGEAQQVDAQPEWATRYWAWKSAPFAPGTPALKFEIATRRETRRATSAPTGGGLAGMGGDSSSGGSTGGGRAGGSGGGTSAADASNAALQSQAVQVTTLRLKDEVVAEYVNAPVTPGLSFGWAPQGRAAIAFAGRDGRLVVMDQQGAKTSVADTKDVLLPAWSDDGTRIAYLQKTGRKRFNVMIASMDAK
jgi:dipeptidyl aminopeptidase/acylaminoacyl peptidase